LYGTAAAAATAGKEEESGGQKAFGNVSFTLWRAVVYHFISSGWDDAVLDDCFQGTASSR
jgi:hypothetical protein